MKGDVGEVDILYTVVDRAFFTAGSVVLQVECEVYLAPHISPVGR